MEIVEELRTGMPGWSLNVPPFLENMLESKYKCYKEDFV